MFEKIKRNQKGFTLIEIIAVLIILGILAAVAVPKFFDLQDQAREKAKAAAEAEAYARVNLTFSKQILQGTNCADVLYNNTNLGTDAGGFTFDWTETTNGAGGTTVSVLITDNEGNIDPPWTASIKSPECD